jgi:hypothetical protein
MSFWDKIQKDLSKNIKEGLAIVKEGGTIVSKKIEEITEEGKKKYKIFNLNMKVQEEFARLGGQIYDLTVKKSPNPLSNRKVVSILKKINRLETKITKLEAKEIKKTRKSTSKKSRTRRATQSKSKRKPSKQTK